MLQWLQLPNRIIRRFNKFFQVAKLEDEISKLKKLLRKKTDAEVDLRIKLKIETQRANDYEAITSSRTKEVSSLTVENVSYLCRRAVR